MPPRQVHVAGVARSERLCSGQRAIRSPGVETSLGIDRPRDPPRSTIAIELVSPARCQVLSAQSHVFRPSQSLCRVRAQGRGLEPREVNQIGTRPPCRRGNAGRSNAPAPQSKPVTPASRLEAQVAPSVAFGLGLRILAAGPARVSTLLRLQALCEPELKSLLGSSAGAGIG